MPDNTESAFSGNIVDSYSDGPPRQVPGYASLHRMVSLLLAEQMPAAGRVLVLGAGGGQEIKALADAHPEWSFDGVDPSADMLRLAKRAISPHEARVRLHEGYIGNAPEELFDAATCILTFHFIPREQRLGTLKEIRRRLQNGAPFILVHLSFPQTDPERSKWIARHVTYGLADEADPSRAEAAREAIGSKLTILSPEEDVAMLKEAGFSDVSLFYAGLSIKGWVAYAG
ncbi:class I SAM-dependent methyltransferase [Collimonas pratensis]|uniref:Methyltransferase domain protein n=1 Tax=Collimonas pratensis TaxID=279113 RepID=A0ABM5Z5C1_9BURK|nr:class I SAM-dependent methyltransferase [Collimonas pratensis]AMP14083.1 methyltransferase domain protein [Collimonas pratensis]NKI68686.1 methyltransferase domain-containing protein [Collimonas pratensis]